MRARFKHRALYFYQAFSTMITHEFTLLQTVPAFLLALILFVLLISFYLVGYKVRQLIINKATRQVGELGAVNGALLGLLALLLAFTFSMSNDRYNLRRSLVIEEANAIGTAILRTDLYPDSIRIRLRSQFREYVEARISFYEAQMAMDEMVHHFGRANTISADLWKLTADYAKVDPITTKTSELIPALNAMIDITTTRRAAGEATIPDSILYFLFILCLSASFLLGYDYKNKFDWIVVTGFSLMLSITVFTIIDLDRPRSGLINMDVPNEKIKELRNLFTE